MNRIYAFMILCMLSLESYGRYLPPKGSYGDIAATMLGPVDAIIYVLQVASMSCGAAMAMGALFKFGAWRRNPHQTTLGVPIVMMLTGIGLVLLGYLHYVKYLEVN